MFYSWKVTFEKKNLVLPIEKFQFLVLARNAMLQHLNIQFSLHYLSTGRLREVKNKGKFQTFISKSGRGCLREVPNIEIWLGEVVAYEEVTMRGSNVPVVWNEVAIEMIFSLIV